MCRSLSGRQAGDQPLPPASCTIRIGFFIFFESLFCVSGCISFFFECRVFFTCRCTPVTGGFSHLGGPAASVSFCLGHPPSCRLCDLTSSSRTPHPAPEAPPSSLCAVVAGGIFAFGYAACLAGSSPGASILRIPFCKSLFSLFS